MSLIHIDRTDAPLRGEVFVPGDKSISHRAVLFSGASRGISHLSGVLDSADVHASIVAMRSLGAEVDVSSQEDGSLAGTVTGWGQVGPSQDHVEIDCGNSGTTARLLLGLLGGAGVNVTLTGDDSLQSRPMKRVVSPLELLGCDIVLESAGTLPAKISPPKELVGRSIDTQLSSAQVKSAILLAGIYAQGTTQVTEVAQSRNHTELLLPAFGVEVDVSSQFTSSVTGPSPLSATDIVVPGDPSSAAFLAVAAALIPDSNITMENISLNPTRTGFIEVLMRMGCAVEVTEGKPVGKERTGSVQITYTKNLSGCTVTSEEIPSLIDEIPILSLLATIAQTETRFCDTGELRIKESNRLDAIIDGITALGGSAYADGDDLIIKPQRVSKGKTMNSLGDHRLAMTWAIAGLIIDGGVTVDGFDAVNVSFPMFYRTIMSLKGAK